MRESWHCSRLQGREKQARSSANMLSASSGVSLRKTGSAPASIYVRPPGHALGEALDEQGRPLCLLPKMDILKQGLSCRCVAILAIAPDNSILLSSMPGPVFDITCHDLVSAGWAASEYAAWLVEQSLGMAAPVNPVAALVDGPVEISFFSANLSSSYLAVREDQEFLLSHITELGELAARELTTPLLHSAMKAFNP